MYSIKFKFISLKKYLLSASSLPGIVLGIRDLEMDTLVTGLKEARDKPITTFAQCARSCDADVRKSHWKPSCESLMVLRFVSNTCGTTTCHKETQS